MVQQVQQFLKECLVKTVCYYIIPLINDNNVSVHFNFILFELAGFLGNIHTFQVIALSPTNLVQDILSFFLQAFLLMSQERLHSLYLYFAA